METIIEALSSAAYFSLNPLAWVAAIVISVHGIKLRSPIIAAVVTQTLFGGVLITLIAVSDRAFPVRDIFVMILIPAVLSGILISTVVILFTKRRRLIRRVSSLRPDRLAYK
jgi:hypothetical protein